MFVFYIDPPASSVAAQAWKSSMKKKPTWKKLALKSKDFNLQATFGNFLGDTVIGRWKVKIEVVSYEAITLILSQ